MKVSEIMSRSVDLSAPTMTVREVAQRMKANDIGALPVGENDRLVGMITDRDIAVRVVAEGKDPTSCTVREAMSEGIYYCSEDSSVEDAARIMAEHQVHRLPVVNQDKRMVGIVATADIARAGVGSAEKRAMEGISEPSGQPRR
jgi:CBS domain-containing protein